MATIISQLISIIDNPAKWNYYESQDLTWQYKNISNVDLCYDFIRQYIVGSQKDTCSFETYIRALKMHQENGQQIGARLQHIVSICFMGLALYSYNPFIKKHINIELNSLRVFDDNDVIEKEFVFVWFMICMFHDLGYVFEKNITSDDYGVADLQKDKEELIKSISKLPKKNNLPNHYKDILEKYLKYRGLKDHGILGGLSFSKHVCTLRKQKYESSLDNTTRRKWKPELDRLYKYVAWRICCHNIFYIRIGDATIEHTCKYFYYGLYQLMLCNRKKTNNCYADYPIHFKESPLLFFLCLIDSIDPIKLCGVIPQDLIIKCHENGKLLINCSDKDYLAKVDDIKDWLVGKKGEGYVL